MTDLFIQEIDEAVRKDQYEKLWQQYGRGVMIGCVIVVLGVAGYSWFKNQQTTKLEAATASLAETLQGLAPGKEAEVSAALASAATTAPGHLPMLERFYAASLAANAGKAEDALAQYALISADSSVSATYQDLAKLLSVQVQLDTGDIETLKAQLAPLAKDGAAWRFSAREMQAMLALRANDTATAKTILDALTTEPDAPASLKARAGQILATIAG